MLYAPPVTLPRRRHLLAAPLLGCVLGLACGDERDTETTPRAGGDDGATAVSERLLEGEPLEALAVLRTSHASIRERLGPHALTCETTLSLAPTRPAAPNPAVDTPVPPTQAIHDTVALRWETPDDAGLRFALEQHNDKDRGRAVVVTNATLYARLEHRPWTYHRVESDVYELWLDDAWRSAHDALEFLLPGAEVTREAAPGEGWDGGDAVRLTLALGRGTAVPGRSEGWRADVAFSALAGTLLIDAQTGAWLALDATATYSVEGGAGGPLAGEFAVHGRVAPGLPGAPNVTAPTEAVALPQRHRYEQERKRLLDGLAAP